MEGSLKSHSRLLISHLSKEKHFTLNMANSAPASVKKMAVSTSLEMRQSLTNQGEISRNIPR